jgi:aminomethyltransferase
VINNLHEEYGVIALQGPRAGDVLASLNVDINLEYMSFKKVLINSEPVILCRTGYTGEFGFEIVPAAKSTSAIWASLVEAISPYEGLICGLGARDTLRTEMGYPLHGHELSLEISPLQAAAGWSVGWKKEKFTGRESLLAEKKSGPRKVLRGLSSSDRGIPRAGMQVKNRDGQIIGEITSGTFSPTLKNGIALALLNPETQIGVSVIVDVR